MAVAKLISPISKQSIRKLRVTSYCRVSTSSADQLNSYANQVRYYTKLIKSKAEWELVEVFADEGISGMRADNRNVFIHKTSSNNLWQIISGSNGDFKIVPDSNTTFGLNYYWTDELGNPGNCDIYPHSGNEDAIVEYISNHHESQMPIGRIKLVRGNVDLYLTIDGTSDNSNVSWQPYEGSYSQM